MNHWERFLVPHPVKVEEKALSPCRLTDQTGFIVPKESAIIVKKWAFDFWGITITPTVSEFSRLEPEAYELDVDEAMVTIRAASLDGVRHAMRTLRQLAEPERGVATSLKWEVPACSIGDSPKLKFRGLHICWYPESEVWEIEKSLRLASYYKFNYLVMEFRGTFPFQSHPELFWSELHADRNELKRLINLAAELGLRLIPLFNMLGHGTGVGIGIGKHVTLGTNPQYASLWEPDGWSLCLSNPHIRPLMKDAFEEMYDFFEKPEYFHAGFDEPFNLGTCSRCRKQDTSALLSDYLKFLHNLMADRNCRMMLWHDAFVDRNDPRWKGYVIDDRLGSGFDGLLPNLPKDIVFTDWHYDYPEVEGKAPTWPLSDYFADQGFDVLLSPWCDEKGILSMARKAAVQQFPGILQTSWHRLAGTMQQRLIFLVSANAAWNQDWEPESGFGDECTILNYHVRQIDGDIGLIDYHRSGTQKNMHFF